MNFIYVTCLFLLLSLSVIAAETITVMSGINKPPYVIQKENSGFEIELIHSIISSMGKSAEFSYVNYGRASKMLYMQGVDAVMSTNKKVFVDESVLTEPYIYYQNVAISLAENNFKINTITDLAKHSIVSFQLAHKVLGQLFYNAAMSSPMYVQMSDQARQPEMLFRKRTDIVIAEKQIFYSLLAQSSWASKADDAKVHYVFPKTAYSMAFKDRNNVALFNVALRKVLATKEYIQLRLKYGFD
ncbi:ABC transporter substrate-binding protein [Paraglaciecola sp. L3A3]|uniref:substrate-binding periplasmic protein n=1 Tax=Paraglaciecola sp. L3A3 TaxID=2686358 RepID=UPI00131DFAE2|nr:transporter substrate-binding domain-containing protein [Paraglaciecola sp. L3A3]